MQLDRAVAHGGGRGGVGGGYGNIVVHGGDIGDVTPNCEGSKPLPLAGGVWGGVWRCQTLPAATSGTSPQVSLPLPQAGGEQVLLRRLLRLVGLRLALARFRRRRGDFEGQRVADLGIFAGLHLHLDLAAMDELAEEQFLGERLLDLFLDQAAHRTRAIELVIALAGQPVAVRIVELDVDVALGKLQFQLPDEIGYAARDAFGRQKIGTAWGGERGWRKGKR